MFVIHLGSLFFQNVNMVSDDASSIYICLDWEIILAKASGFSTPAEREDKNSSRNVDSTPNTEADLAHAKRKQLAKITYGDNAS